jgi:hypothetical protein
MADGGWRMAVAVAVAVKTRPSAPAARCAGLWRVRSGGDPRPVQRPGSGGRLIHSERRPAGQVPATESASVVFQGHKVQAFSLFGAFLLLLAYGGQQLRLISAEAVAYQLLNLVGASILLRRAIQDQSYGFILLESFWMVVSLIGLIHCWRRRGGAAIKSSGRAGA